MKKFKAIMLGVLSALTLGLFVVTGTKVNAETNAEGKYVDNFNFDVNSTSYTSTGTYKFGLTATAASKGSNSNFKISKANSILGNTTGNYSYGVKLNASGNLKFTPEYDWEATLLIAAGATNSTVKYGDNSGEIATEKTSATYTATEVTLSGSGGSEITIVRDGGEVYVYEMILTQTPQAATDTLDSISISNNKTSFYVEDALPTANSITVTATYKDSNGDVTREKTVDSSKYTVTVKQLENVIETSTFEDAGNYTVNVSYTDNNVTKTTSYEITVNELANGSGTIFSADSISTSYSFQSNKIIAGTIYTIIAKEGSSFSVDTQQVTVDGKTIKNRLKTGGTAATDDRIVKVSAPSEGVLYVIAAASGSSGTRKVTLYDNSDLSTNVGSYETVTSGSSFVFGIDEAKDYYLGSNNNGINIYYIEFIPKSVTVMQQEAHGETTSGSETTYIRFIALVQGVTDINSSDFTFKMYCNNGTKTVDVTANVKTYSTLKLAGNVYKEMLPGETEQHTFNGGYGTEFYAIYIVELTNKTYNGCSVYAGFKYKSESEQLTTPCELTLTGWTA